MKRFLSGSLAAALLTTGCTQVETKPVVNPIKVPAPKKVKNAVETVYGRAFIKRDYLVQKPAEITLSVNFGGGTLRDFVKYLSSLGIVVDYDPILSARRIPPIKGVMSLRELLNRASFAANCYWEAKGRYVKFEKDKIVAYQFPIFSQDFLEGVFGFDADDTLLKALKDDFFKSLKDSLPGVLQYDEKGSVSVKQSVTYTRQTGNKESVQDSLKAGRKEETNTGYSVQKKNNNQETSRKKSGRTEEEKKNNSYAPKKKGMPLTIENTTTNRHNASREKNSETQKAENRVSSSGGTKERTKEKQRQVVKERLGETSEKEEVTTLLQATNEEGKGKFAVVPSLGELVVRVTPLEESRVDQLVRELSREVLGKMVSLKVYVLELKTQQGMDYNLTLNLLKRAYRHEAGLQLGAQGQITFTTLSQDYLSGIAHGIDVTSLVNYILSCDRAKIVSSSTLLTIPRVPARISSVVQIPFAVPTSISQGGTNPTLTYDIKTVDDGFRMRIVPSVLDDGTIVMAIALKENRYLGDKTVQAGNVGTITLPIQAPRKLSTVVRCRPGDVVFIGGIRKYQENLSSARNLGIPYQKNENRQYSELYILIQPKLILFKEKNHKTHKEVRR